MNTWTNLCTWLPTNVPRGMPVVVHVTSPMHVLKTGRRDHPFSQTSLPAQHFWWWYLRPISMTWMIISVHNKFTKLVRCCCVDASSCRSLVTARLPFGSVTDTRRYVSSWDSTFSFSEAAVCSPCNCLSCCSSSAYRWNDAPPMLQCSTFLQAPGLAARRHLLINRTDD